MEQNMPIVAKKFWNIVRVFYMVLRRQISKGKLLFHLNMALHRAKLADKVVCIRNHLFHNIYHHTSASSTVSHHQYQEPVKEYNLNTKNSSLPPLHVKRRKRNWSPAQTEEFMMASPLDIFHSAVASPAVFGESYVARRQDVLGASPVVRQVRITDSPFPVSDDPEDVGKGVDEDAEEFITKFYHKLRKQYGING